MAARSWKEKFEAMKQMSNTTNATKESIAPDMEIPVQKDIPEIIEAPLQNENISGEKESDQSGIIFLSPDILDQYHNDPFRAYTGQRLEQLAESIRQYGIISPIVVRPKDGGRYEILSGRNRNNAAKANGLPLVPCIVKDVDDDDAALIVAESNLNQRENLLPSEKAFAYKMQFEALKNQGKSHAKNFDFSRDYSDDGQQNQSLCHDGKNGDATRTAYRYLRLTNLTSELLQLVDDNILSLIAAEHISYLERDEQIAVIQYFFTEKRAALDVNTAKLLRERSQQVELTYNLIDELLQKKKKTRQAPSVSLKMTKLQKYVPDGISKKTDIEKYIITALAYYKEYGEERISNEQG